MSNNKTVGDLSPIWIHSVTRESVSDPAQDQSKPPTAVQLTIVGETPDGGEFTQVIGIPAAAFSEICHQIRANP